MIAAVLALAALAAGLGAGLVWAVKLARDERREAKQASDLYRAQCEVTLDLETERRELTSKLAATDEQLREALRRLSLTEAQRNKALEEAREQVRKEIRNAPDAIAALNRVLAAAHGLQRDGETTTAPAATEPGAGRGGTDSLLIAELR